MIGHDGAWLPSVTLGLPAIGLGVAVCVALIVLALRRAEDIEELLVFCLLPGFALLGLIIGPAFGYWPYGGDYHRLQPTVGVVESVDTRFLAASQYVVVTYQGGQTVRCDDSRCATVRPGDTLRLLCTKEHQFGSPQEADGWGCRWGTNG